MAEQPMPVTNDREPIVETAIKLLRSRGSVGFERYGGPLQPFNGRDFGQDADEEIADFFLYFLGMRIENRQRMAENEKLIEELAANVREWLCVTCQQVYPGPPQPGFHCVLCPKCGGHCGPKASMERRRAESGLAQAERTLNDVLGYLSCQSIETFQERLSLLKQAAQYFCTLVRSGVIGGHDHPYEFCKCGNCACRRLYAKLNDAGLGK